ncbi:MAG: peptidoglycan-associated lipoprotein, partial [Candidatus Accumulibacter sp.]|nr:peptidoglycan-associated lipoprotein [Accumulibacter sp.]
MKRFLIPSLFLLLTAACGSTPPEAEQSAAPIESRSASDGRVTTVTAGNVNGHALPGELTDPANILSRRSVYFDYDKFDIKPEYRDLVAAHADFLVNNRQFRM